jgi:hypothetical protein
MNIATAERYPTQEIADIEIYGHTTKLRAVMRNLSLTGAALEIVGDDKTLRKGDLINITVQLDSIAKIHNVDAEVVWTSGAGMGVCFVKRAQVVERIFMRSEN